MLNRGRTTGSCRTGRRARCKAFVRPRRTPLARDPSRFRERSLVQPLEQFANRIIQIRQPKKVLRGVGRQDPAFDKLTHQLRPWPCLWMMGRARTQLPRSCDGTTLTGLRSGSVAAPRLIPFVGYPAPVVLASRKLFKKHECERYPRQRLVPGGFGYV